MIYGYDVESQVRETKEADVLAKHWAKHNHQQVQTLALPPTPMENLLVGYLSSGFAVGETFALPAALAALPTNDIDSASTVVLGAFVDACCQPCQCTSKLVKGSCIFSVVDSNPGQRNIDRNNAAQKSNSIVLVRVHAAMQSAGTEVPQQSRIEIWDLRSFARDDATAKQLLGCLMRVTVMHQSTLLACASVHPPLQLTAPAPVLSRMAHTDKHPVASTADCNLLLNDLFRQGLTECQKSKHSHTLERLLCLGAIDDRCVIQPAGVIFSTSLRVQTLVHDMVFSTPAQKALLTDVSKLELLAMLLDAGFRPLETLEGKLLRYVPGGDPIVSTSMIMRSKLYFVALLQSQRLFSEGLKEFHHACCHAYYHCLLHIGSFDAINAIDDVPAVPSSRWGELEGNVENAHLALEDDHDDGVVTCPIVFPPPAAAVAPPAWMEAQSFPFQCETQTGTKTFTLCLDGFSHNSHRRRAYAQCRQEGHERCFKYVFMDTFDEPWKSVAYLLCYLRRGILCSSKAEHMALDPITDGEMDAVHDEMPAMLFTMML